MRTNALFLYLALFLTFPFLITSCNNNDDDDLIGGVPPKEVPELPASALLYLKNYLTSEYVSPKVSLSTDKSIYEVSYKSDSLQIFFDKDGNWLESKSLGAMPKSLLESLPKEMTDAATKFHVNDTIKHIQKKSYGYMYGLQKTQLGYDNNGRYLGYDEESKEDVLATNSKQFIRDYFKGTSVEHVLFNAEDYSKRYYLVYLNCDYILKFDYNTGVWFSIDAVDKVFPSGVWDLIPQNAKDYLIISEKSPLVSVLIEDQGIYTFRDKEGIAQTIVTSDYQGPDLSGEEIQSLVFIFIKKHWSNEVFITGIQWSSNVPNIYGYTLSNGYQIKLNNKGKLLLIDAGGEEMEESIIQTLPYKLQSTLDENYKSDFVTKIEFLENEDYKITFGKTSSVVVFDKEGNFYL